MSAPDTAPDTMQKAMAMAQQLDGIANALNACIDNPENHSLCVHLIERAAVLAPLLLRGLDNLDSRPAA